MPTKEPIPNRIIPQEAPKPIPERIAITRSPNKITQVQENGNQPATVRSEAGADSPTPEESVKLSPQVSALARKEQAFRQRELALKQREKDLESKLAKADQFEQLQSKLSSKDFSEAEKLGLNYEEYTQYLIDKQSGEDPQSKAFKELKAEIDALKKQQEESVAQSFDETVAAYKEEITKAVSSNPEFSSIKELKREDAVLQLILDSWEEDQEEVSVEQACKDIEEALLEYGKTFSSISKLKPAPVEAKPLPPPRGSRTLTHDLAPVGSEKKPRVELQRLSDAERYAEARRRVEARKQKQG